MCYEKLNKRELRVLWSPSLSAGQVLSFFAIMIFKNDIWKTWENGTAYLWMNAGSYSQHFSLTQILYFQNIIIHSAKEPMCIRHKAVFITDTLLRVHASVSWRGVALCDKSHCSILPYFWSKIGDEIEVVAGNTDHVEGQWKAEVGVLNAMFGSTWRAKNQTKPNKKKYIFF